MSCFEYSHVPLNKDGFIKSECVEMWGTLAWLALSRHFWWIKRFSDSFIKCPLKRCIDNRDGTIHLPPDSILTWYVSADTICIAIFFLRFSILQVLWFDIAVLRFYFLFLTLDHEEKLNDTLHIQTGTIIIIIKKHLSSNLSGFISFSLNINKNSTKKILFEIKSHQTSSINNIKWRICESFL